MLAVSPLDRNELRHRFRDEQSERTFHFRKRHIAESNAHDAVVRVGALHVRTQAISDKARRSRDAAPGLHEFIETRFGAAQFRQGRLRCHNRGRLRARRTADGEVDRKFSRQEIVRFRIGAGPPGRSCGLAWRRGTRRCRAPDGQGSRCQRIRRGMQDGNLMSAMKFVSLAMEQLKSAPRANSATAQFRISANTRPPQTAYAALPDQLNRAGNQS